MIRTGGVSPFNSCVCAGITVSAVIDWLDGLTSAGWQPVTSSDTMAMVRAGEIRFIIIILIKKAALYGLYKLPLFVHLLVYEGKYRN